MAKFLNILVLIIWKNKFAIVRKNFLIDILGSVILYVTRYLLDYIMCKIINFVLLFIYCVCILLILFILVSLLPCDGE